MQGSSWLSFIRRVPAAQHDVLVFVTNNGTEIMLNSIIRIEPDFMIIRGRVAGSQEGLRVVIVPFDQINFMSMNRKVLDEECNAMFGPIGTIVTRTNDVAVQTQENLGTIEPPQAIVVQAAVDPPAEPKGEGEANTSPEAAKPNQMSKSMLLARLRARLAKAP